MTATFSFTKHIIFQICYIILKMICIFAKNINKQKLCLAKKTTN